MTCVTCIAHGCNHIAKKVWELFSNINILFNTGKNYLYNHLSELEEKINIILRPKEATIKTKPNCILSKNKGLNVLRKINKVLLGEVAQFDEIYQDPIILSCSKYAPTTSVNVE